MSTQQTIQQSVEQAIQDLESAVASLEKLDFDMSELETAGKLPKELVVGRSTLLGTMNRLDSLRVFLGEEVLTPVTKSVKFGATKTGENDMSIPTHRSQAEALIKATNGQFFTATFVKADNTTRVMNCRLKVTKGLTGAGRTWNPADQNMITVFDMKKDDYRTLNLNTLLEATIGGKRYVFFGDIPFGKR